MTAPIAIFSVLLMAAGPSETKSADAIVAEAQALVLKGKRPEAAELLVKALSHYSGKEPEARTLMESLDRISALFLTDKGLKAYELAESLQANKSPHAEQKYQEALNLEPGNVKIIGALVKESLVKDNCKKGQSYLVNGLQIHPFLVDFQVYSVRIKLCLGDLEGVNQWFLEERKQKKLGPNLWYWALRLEASVRQNELREAASAAERLAKLDSKFPELYYWKWKMNQDLPQPASEEAAKYLEACKTLAAAQRKNYLLEPLLCSRLQEVEKYIESQQSFDKQDES